MQYLALYVVSTVLFFQALRFGQVKGLSEMVVSAVNYVVAAVLALMMLVASDLLGYDQHISNVALFGGAALGTGYFVYLFVLFRAYNYFGIGITMALVQVGTSLTAVYAWAVYGDRIGFLQWIGLAVIPAALLLMRPQEQKATDQTANEKGDAESQTECSTLRPKRNALAVLAVFLLATLMQTGFAVIHDAVQRFDPHVELGFWGYSAAVFTAAGVLNVGYVLLFERRRYPIGTCTVGSLAGLANLSLCVFVVFALDVVGPTIVLPTAAVAIIGINLVVAKLYWKETITRQQYVGLACTFLVVLMMNLDLSGDAMVADEKSVSGAAVQVDGATQTNVLVDG